MKMLAGAAVGAMVALVAFLIANCYFSYWRNKVK